MSAFSPTVPITSQIRKIVFDNFNDMDLRFNNDQIFEIIKQNGDADPNWTIDDVESFFHDLCQQGFLRNIAQNFTTMWFKLSDEISVVKCPKCGVDNYLSSSEEKICQTPECGII